MIRFSPETWYVNGRPIEPFRNQRLDTRGYRPLHQWFAEIGPQRFGDRWYESVIEPELWKHQRRELSLAFARRRLELAGKDPNYYIDSRGRRRRRAPQRCNVSTDPFDDLMTVAYSDIHDQASRDAVEWGFLSPEEACDSGVDRIPELSPEEEDAIKQGLLADPSSACARYRLQEGFLEDVRQELFADAAQVYILTESGAFGAIEKSVWGQAEAPHWLRKGWWPRQGARTGNWGLVRLLVRDDQAAAPVGRKKGGDEMRSQVIDALLEMVRSRQVCIKRGWRTHTAAALQARFPSYKSPDAIRKIIKDEFKDDEVAKAASRKGN